MLKEQHVKETNFYLKGQKIAAKIWGDENLPPMLALHGWLDNAGSFDAIAPYLDHHIVAVDLPGHGWSGHKSESHYLHIIDYVMDMIHFVHDVLHWEQFALLGHSLGGAISSLMAAAIPERITKVVLIDGLGPITTPAERAPEQLRLYLQQTLGKPQSRIPVYTDIEMAINARLKVNAMLVSSARAIVERGVKENEDGTLSWRTDPRLLKASPLQLTEEQTLAFLGQITAPILVVRPEPGFSFPKELMKGRVAAIPHLQIVRLPGQHHIHLDEPLMVAEVIKAFFNNTA